MPLLLFSLIVVIIQFNVLRVLVYSQDNRLNARESVWRVLHTHILSAEIIRSINIYVTHNYIQILTKFFQSIRCYPDNSPMN